MKITNPEFFITDKDWDKVLNYARAAYDHLKAEIGGMAVITTFVFVGGIHIILWMHSGVVQIRML